MIINKIGKIQMIHFFEIRSRFFINWLQNQQMVGFILRYVVYMKFWWLDYLDIGDKIGENVFVREGSFCLVIDMRQFSDYCYWLIIIVVRSRTICFVSNLRKYLINNATAHFCLFIINILLTSLYSSDYTEDKLLNTCLRNLLQSRSAINICILLFKLEKD